MTRSILWISSRAPSSPFSIGCVALPQPRSRTALAAAIRAGGGALVFRMTPTSTFSAVLVWLRASERISLSVLAIVTRGRARGRPSLRLLDGFPQRNFVPRHTRKPPYPRDPSRDRQNLANRERALAGERAGGFLRSRHSLPCRNGKQAGQGERYQTVGHAGLLKGE
jgi:hypothetical protein